ncbi:uncharacterized protein LOC122389814 [Amphibalanus amphitrite]|uniref:uncharacterized protein LOC122389814 n=1 Tax=Amphibalanus amphitrite TaxID=1232801 RepID=UPI001C907937|nr:uncharacterized protein LOC122389814 [Amphibalanus amphitrite]
MRSQAVLLTCCLLLAPSTALPFVSDWLGNLELSLPTGGEEEWTLKDAALRVEDSMRQTLKRMATDATERVTGGIMEDPLPVPASLEQEILGSTFRLNNIVLTGMRDYEVKLVQVDLKGHEYTYELQFPALSTLGQYVLDYYWRAWEGDFTISMYDVTARGRGLLDVCGNGTVRLNSGHSHVEVTYARIHADLGSPLLVEGAVQTAVGALGPYLFDVIKPSTLDRVNGYLQRHCQPHVKELDEERMLTGSFAMVDSAVLEARKRVRQAGYDPLPLPDISQASSGVEVELSHGVLTGLSNLKRSGDVALGVLDQTAKATLALGTERVTGKYRWTVRGFNLLERSGFVKFSVDSLKLRARLAQVLTLRERPRIDDLDVDLGKLTFRAEGLGSMDYALNVGAQSFPGMLKTIIVKAVEAPLVWIIENQFNDLVPS